MKIALLFVTAVSLATNLLAQQPVPVKPRILISTDIGGTDPDDNQSMTHFLMYSYLFNTEGLVSSPSYGKGSTKEIFRMIDLYEKDLPSLKKHNNLYPSPEVLRNVVKQGKQGAAPFIGYSQPTEGSKWIITCAKKKSTQPLWILVWGGLEDVAQAMHDDPSIEKNIRVYWIGGPNKKWSANSYAYIAANFPDLWMIENNAAYNGFFTDTDEPDTPSSLKYNAEYIRGAGYLGKDFINYYRGNVKMGDTPSLLYMMDGDPNNPFKESWGGSFETMNHSPRLIFNRNTTNNDTVTVCSVIEFHFKGPHVNIPKDSACITMAVKAKIGEQKWPGFYLGDGEYVVRYCPKRTEAVTYTVESTIAGFSKQEGAFFVDNIWPGNNRSTDYRLGKNWYTDKSDPSLFIGIQQGAKTIFKWRKDALMDWAKIWNVLR